MMISKKRRSKAELTSSEVAQIKDLIIKKLESDGDQQKRIRNQIRKIGYYHDPTFTLIKKGTII